MYRLIYVSRSVTRFPPDLKTILASSRKNNAKFGITGALCFLDGVYCQYLEGEKINVENLFKILQGDPRHQSIKLIELCSISHRLFTNWTMALVTWNKQTRTLFKSLNPLGAGDSVDLYALNTLNAAATFNLLAHSANWMELAPDAKPN